MKKHTANNSGHHCSVLEQRHLVSQMTHCDSRAHNAKDTYECYLKATKESRENQACMYA